MARTGASGRRWHRDPARDECYSPAWVVEWARRVLGGIDLDPASCAAAQRTVQARRWIGLPDDGLRHEWAGAVWLNPPWGAGQKRLWVAKLLAERRVTAWVCLLPADFSNAGVIELACAAAAVHICAQGRVRYARPDGTSTQGWFASALFVGGGGLRPCALTPPEHARWVTGRFEPSREQRLPGM